MWETIKTPAYVVDEKKLRENLECLHRVEEETGMEKARCIQCRRV